MSGSPHSATVTRFDLWLYCLATGLSVAAVVYHQSMITIIARGLESAPGALWSLSVATQIGYGLGLVLGLPFGDIVIPRRLIPAVVMILGMIVMLLAAAPNLTAMVVLCFFAGFFSIGGQLLIAYCAKISSPERRAKVVSALFSSLFAGLLFARALSGLGAELIGWRIFYLTVGAATMVIGIALKVRGLHTFDRVTLRYGALLLSQIRLWRQTSELRWVALIAACFFAALSGIWANLASLLHQTLQWSATQIGMLAFTALAGLHVPHLVALLRRSLSWTQTVMLLGAMTAVVSFSGFVLGPTTPMLVVFLMMVDVCARGVQVICQSRALAIDPAASARINSLFMTVFFLGSALGSWLGGIAVQDRGWSGMCLFPAVCVIAGIGLAWLRRSLDAPMAVSEFQGHPINQLTDKKRS